VFGLDVRILVMFHRYNTRVVHFSATVLIQFQGMMKHERYTQKMYKKYLFFTRSCYYGVLALMHVLYYRSYRPHVVAY
jgi:hypothetical protein